MRTLLVTAYTPSYWDHARRLERSYVRIGGPGWMSCMDRQYDDHPVPLDIPPQCGFYSYFYADRGSWELNCQVKPEVILRAMDLVPDRPVCWLDADAELMAAPTLLDTLPMDRIAAHRFNTNEVLACTLFVPPAARPIVERWRDACAEHPELDDQRVLRSVIGEDFTPLPPEYAWLDTLSKRAYGPGEPVIYQWQQSRAMHAARRAEEAKR